MNPGPRSLMAVNVTTRLQRHSKHPNNATKRYSPDFKDFILESDVSYSAATKNGYVRENEGKEYRKKTLTDEAGLDDDRRIWKAGEEAQQREKWRRYTLEPPCREAKTKIRRCCYSRHY